MSALTNGAMKKNDKLDVPTIYDIGSSKGIVIGRGYEDQVASKAVQQEYPLPMTTTPSMEQLDQFIEESSLTAEGKAATKTILHDKLLAELQNGEQANVVVIKEQLTDITSRLPGIRVYLRSFIENYEGISKTIRILTNKLLD
jgi:hypothetical protein